MNEAATAIPENEFPQITREQLVELGLKRQMAYVPDSKAKVKSKNAARQAKYREKLKQEGLVKITVPADVAEKIKSGVTLTPPLTPDQKRLLGLGRCIDQLKGWRGRLVCWLSGIAY